jgi:ribosome modulation factor
MMSKDAHEEGYRAANRGQDLAENPYPKGDLRHASWADGWLDAIQDLDLLDDD